MKIIPFIIFLSFLCINSAHAMKSSSTPSSSYLSVFTTTVSSTTFTLGALFFEILNFNPREHQTIKKRRSLTTTKVSENLFIIAPSKIEVKKDGHYLLVNGEYYDSTLEGKFYWTNGQLNHKDRVEFPLV